jgi:hypothetical protein
MPSKLRDAAKAATSRVFTLKPFCLRCSTHLPQQPQQGLFRHRWSAGQPPPQRWAIRVLLRVLFCSRPSNRKLTVRLQIRNLRMAISQTDLFFWFDVRNHVTGFRFFGKAKSDRLAGSDARQNLFVGHFQVDCRTREPMTMQRIGFTPSHTLWKVWSEVREALNKSSN